MLCMCKITYLRLLTLLLALLLVTALLTGCDMAVINGVDGFSPSETDSGSSENLTSADAPSDDTSVPSESESEVNESATLPENGGSHAPVLSHTYVLNGPYDVKGGYISGTESPFVTLSLGNIFDLNMMKEQDFLCRISVVYDAAVQGDHLNLRFSLSMGGSFVLVDNYRYLDNDETARLQHNAYTIRPDTYSRTGDLTLSWDTKGVTSLDGINHCRITGVTVYVEFYSDAPQETAPDEDPSEDLITRHDFILDGRYTVRGGYISGTTTPSVSVDLSEVFDLKTLAELGYLCTVSISYTAEVQGDHLNLRCIMDGVAVVAEDYVFLEDNEKSNLYLGAENIPGEHYKTFTAVYLKWDCKGITALDGLNECIVSNVIVDVTFSK